MSQSKGSTEYSAGGIIIRKNKILLVFETISRMWAFPKGHLEDQENEREAAQREIKEESGITELHFIKNLGEYIRPTKKSPYVTKHITMFLFATHEMKVHSSSPDVSEAIWVEFDQVLKKLSYQEDREFYSEVAKPELMKYIARTKTR